MAEPLRPLILANGELYASDIERASGFRSPELPRTFEAARSLVISELQTSLDLFSSLPARKRFDDEVTFCLRMHPGMSAKSYDPSALLSQVPDLSNIGSRQYRTSPDIVTASPEIAFADSKGIDDHVTGKLVFVRSSPSGFQQLLRVLDSAETLLSDRFKRDIQRIEKFNLLDDAEQIQGFETEWTEGRVEMVLHPSLHSPEEQADFVRRLLETSNFDVLRPRLAHYPGGPTFISCWLTNDARKLLAGSNPLRSVHPFEFGGFEKLEQGPSLANPLPPTTQSRSKVKVGLFDGGLIPDHPLLRGHVEEDHKLSIKTAPIQEGIQHGVAVAGTILYGSINHLSGKNKLPKPEVFVVGFRVFPTSDPTDVDLYEAIDVIEKVVPARRDISTYVLPFGPRGALEDDTVSRFTYALDALASCYNVTFVVAAGNDGDAGEGYDRIQAPADMANGIAVGAFTNKSGKAVHAPYSSKGPGREGAKIKPDVVAFGGCEKVPIQLIAADSGTRKSGFGTSFAVGPPASIIAQTTDGFDKANPLLARALLVHTARHPVGTPDILLGHGVVAREKEEILRCSRDEVTIIYQGTLDLRKSLKIPILVPTNLDLGKKLTFTWTVASLPTISAQHACDYTLACIEDTFYPHSRIFRFSPPDYEDGEEGRPLHLDRDAIEVEELIALGWKRSTRPVSDSGNVYKSEEERRSVDCKWEPLVRRQVGKYASSIHEPFLVLHAIPRHGATEPLPYAAVVTISAPKSQADLYGEILTRFPALASIRIRTESEIRVQLG